MLRRLLPLTLAAVLAAWPAAGQTADDIVAKNTQAKGGREKLKSVQSVRVTGRMTAGPGVEAPFTWEWKRPNKLRLEFTVQGMTGIQAYDGTTGWMVMPFMGKTDPEKLPEEEQKLVEEQADFEGALVDYKEKGHQVELVGKETVEGTEAYKLKLTKKGGNVSYLFLDVESCLEFKEQGKRKVRGQEIEFETSLGDYKEVGGLVIAHSIESRPKGAPAGQVFTFEKIELDVTVDDARFKMPEVKKP